MEVLTPNSLALFVQEAQEFLVHGPVDVFQEGIWYGAGCLTVEVDQRGQTLIARFNLGELEWSVAAYSDDASYMTFYQMTKDRLEIDQPVEGKSRMLVMHRQPRG